MARRRDARERWSGSCPSPVSNRSVRRFRDTPWRDEEWLATERSDVPTCGLPARSALRSGSRGDDRQALRAWGRDGATFDAGKTKATPIGAAHDPQWRRCARVAGRLEKLKPDQNQRQRPGDYHYTLCTWRCTALCYVLRSGSLASWRFALPS